MTLLMRILLLTLILNLFCSITFGQNKLILHKGLKRVSIKKGQLIGITLIGEEYKFAKWKNLCKCDNEIRQNLWIVDSLEFDSLKLVGYNYKLSFINDTILRKNLGNLKNKDYIIDTIISSKTGKRRLDKIICKIPSLEILSEKQKKIKYDSIESLTFAIENMEECVKGNNHGYFQYYHFHANEKPSVIIAVILATALTTEITMGIIDVLQNEVKTYQLKDWKTKIKITKALNRKI